jgi:hypothetical protein
MIRDSLRAFADLARSVCGRSLVQWRGLRLIASGNVALGDIQSHDPRSLQLTDWTKTRTMLIMLLRHTEQSVSKSRFVRYGSGHSIRIAVYVDNLKEKR